MDGFMVEELKSRAEAAVTSKLKDEKYVITDDETFAIAILAGVPHRSEFKDGRLIRTVDNVSVRWNGNTFLVAHRSTRQNQKKRQ